MLTGSWVWICFFLQAFEQDGIDVKLLHLVSTCSKSWHSIVVWCYGSDKLVCIHLSWAIVNGRWGTVLFPLVWIVLKALPSYSERHRFHTSVNRLNFIEITFHGVTDLLVQRKIIVNARCFRECKLILLRLYFKFSIHLSNNSFSFPHWGELKLILRYFRWNFIFCFWINWPLNLVHFN